MYEQFESLNITPVKLIFPRQMIFFQKQMVGSRPGFSSGLCKVHKNIIHKCTLFRPTLSVIETLPYKTAKYLVLE